MFSRSEPQIIRSIFWANFKMSWRLLWCKSPLKLKNLFILCLFIYLCTTYIQSKIWVCVQFLKYAYASVCVCVGRHFLNLLAQGSLLPSVFLFFFLDKSNPLFPVFCERVSSSCPSFLQFLRQQIKLLQFCTAASVSLNKAAQHRFMRVKLCWAEASFWNGH